MKDEIKEILDKLKDENNYQVDCNDGSAFKELFANEINLLLDYITNLQEEIDNLRNTIMNDDYTTNKLIEVNRKLSSRNEKAIEYIKKYAIYHNDAGEYYTAYFFAEEYDDLLNILEGEDKDE